MRFSLSRLGAYNGINGSNTLLLERCCNWTGTLIEANPENFAALQSSNRTSVKIHRAVCSGAPSFVNMSLGGGLFAGMPEVRARSLRKRRWARQHVLVPCNSLRHILSDAGQMERIDFLSLDVEGAEEIVLDTVNASRFSVILLEHTSLTSEALDRVHTTLLHAGHARAQHLDPWGSRVYALGNRSTKLAAGSCRSIHLGLAPYGTGVGGPNCSAHTYLLHGSDQSKAQAVRLNVHDAAEDLRTALLATSQSMMMTPPGGVRSLRGKHRNGDGQL